MRLWAGTSGFSHDAWAGVFYPDGLKPAARLGYYAERLSVVELNNTFYRMPSEKNIQGWVDAVAGAAPAFRFVVKATRRLSHFSKMEGVDELVQLLQQRLRGFGDRLGPVLLQLPPTFRADLEKLESFAKQWGPAFPLALEFRHASWWTPELFALLQRHGVACCQAETEAGLQPEPWQPTADFAFFRLRRPDYTQAELTAWAERLSALSVADCYVFFKHEAAAPSHADRLQRLFQVAQAAAETGGSRL